MDRSQNKSHFDYTVCTKCNTRGFFLDSMRSSFWKCDCCTFTIICLLIFNKFLFNLVIKDDIFTVVTFNQVECYGARNDSCAECFRMWENLINIY